MRIPGVLTRLKAEGRLVVEAEGYPVLLVHDRAGVSATYGLCPHRGAPLGDGYVLEGHVVCSWHRSVFRLSDGENVAGPARCPLPVLALEIDGDDILLDPAGPAGDR